MMAASDEAMMRRCLALALSAEGRTAPNPMVGCVVVNKRGRVLAEGVHRKAGSPHAEADALAKLGNKAPSGSTLYVNLEPCRHRGARRTSPCAPLVAASGVSRVVIGMRDPIRSHGGGARDLASAGIEVVVGVLERECRELNRAFVTWARAKRPWITWKAAASLDARVALSSGESEWITGAAARKDGHRLRNRRDAIICGIGTIMADDPSLTCRGVVGGRDPLRVVVDSSLRTPPTARVLPVNQPKSKARMVIATTALASAAKAAALGVCGAEIWRCGGGDRVDLVELCTSLAKEGSTSALLEGGPVLAAAFAAERCIDELILYTAPLLLGGGPTLGGALFAAMPEAHSLAEAARWRFHGAPVLLGDDLRLTLRPVRSSRGTDGGSIPAKVLRS